MNQTDTAHAWWSRLRHQGLLLSPLVLVERYPTAPQQPAFPALPRLRDAQTRFASQIDGLKPGADREISVILSFVDSIIENFIGHPHSHLARQNHIPENMTTVIQIGSRTETIRPHRVLFANDAATIPALLIMADPSPQVGRGRGHTVYSKFLELLRGTGHRLGLLTNGQQFRLIYAGLDFESWCEWESDRWFDESEGTEELCGLKQLLSPESLKPVKEGISGLLDAVEESRKRQADLSSVLRENVRQAIELLLDDVSTANRTNPQLFAPLVSPQDHNQLSDAEAHEAMFQATVRVVMRLVVCLFAESRNLLPVNDPIYNQSYGVRSLYELLDEVTRYEGGTHALFNRQTAWNRLMALFRLIYNGSSHGSFPMRPYGGVLFRPGEQDSNDPVARALYILEHKILVGDATIYYLLRKLLRGPLPVIKGKSKTFVDGPVDYTELRTEFIGLIYEGLLDYLLKRTDEKIGPQIFLNLGREPVLPLSRLTEMLTNDKKGLKDLLTTLRKEKVTASAADNEEEAEADDTDDDTEDQSAEDIDLEAEGEPVKLQSSGDYLDAVESAKKWAREAAVLGGLIGKQKAREPDSEYQARIELEANRLIKRVVATGEFYLVRAGNTRKGTGTFYTRPQLAVPTVHRTLEPLCYDKSEDGTLIPKRPEVILALKVCDPACGSASFLVAALHYLTEALYKSLSYHCQLDNPSQSTKISLPFGRTRTNRVGEEIVPFSPEDPVRGDTFVERVKALLRRHVVERCIYGVDINPLAVELARVSLWVETLDPELPFSFLDHKIMVGNALVGCWLDRVEDYPLKAWEREGGDGKDGVRTQRIEEFLKGEKIGNRRTGDGRIKKEMRTVLTELRDKKRGQMTCLPEGINTDQTMELARTEYEQLHNLPMNSPDERELFYRDHVQGSVPLQSLKAAMNEWCAIWFWRTDEESLRHVPTPLTFHQQSDEKLAIVQKIAKEVKFFHWELEYPDVFTPERSGFDGMIGNPPWDVMKPNSQEFFTEYDPLYRTYEKQLALNKQRELLQSSQETAIQWDDYNARFKALGNWSRNVSEPFDIALARGKDGEALAKFWSNHRSNHQSFADPKHPFHLQGSADLNLYKLFTETFWYLLRFDGRLGIILPTGIYSDLGTKDFREEFLFRGRLEFLYAFQNEKKIFTAADHRYKQVVVFANKGGVTTEFESVFRMGVGDSPHAHEIPEDILHSSRNSMFFTPEDVRANSPKSLSLVEMKSKRDLNIFRKIYSNSIRIGDRAEGWEINYATEFHMTNDSKHFPTLEKWENRGYKPDVFGRWIGPNGDVALPLYQGGMIHQFDPAYKIWDESSSGKHEWINCGYNHKKISARYAISQVLYSELSKYTMVLRVGFRGIARTTDTRTMICSYLPQYPCGNSVFLLKLETPNFLKTFALQTLLNSFVFDWVLRQRMSGSNLNWYIIEGCPLALFNESDQFWLKIIVNSIRLTLLHRRFAPEWLRLKSVFPDIVNNQWKHCWAVTEIDRLRLRVEIDALSANLYGLDAEDLEWVLRDDSKDSNGFYRVDRTLPYRERLTGLAAAAFRALKEGKWSAESASSLSNDEFFEILGIPELTNPTAATALGHAEPLIRKRQGCHVWRPEEFLPEDPRHGWTWEHCWQDAVSLLGSEEAVEAYIEGKGETAEEIASGGTETNHPDGKKPIEQVDLFGNPIEKPVRQKKLF